MFSSFPATVISLSALNFFCLPVMAVGVDEAMNRQGKARTLYVDEI